MQRRWFINYPNEFVCKQHNHILFCFIEMVKSACFGKRLKPARILFTCIMLCLMVYIYLGYESEDIQAIDGRLQGSRNLKAVWPVSVSSQSRKKEAINLAKQEDRKLDAIVSVSVSKVSRKTRPLLTLFTTWTEEADRYTIHNLTVKNWLSLRPYLIPVVFTNESTIANECRRQGFDVLPVRVTAAGGIPVLKYMYEDTMNTYNSSFYGYSNSDILFSETLIQTLSWILNTSINFTNPIMIVGKRTNVSRLRLNDTRSWKKFHAVALCRGVVFAGKAEDYFITSRSYPWNDIPEVVIGRPAYDNWIVYNARKNNHTLIDATKTLLAVHQTTGKGNDEGRSRTNSSYNLDLLTNMYKEVNFQAGMVQCITTYTKYVRNKPVFAERHAPKYCLI